MTDLVLEPETLRRRWLDWASHNLSFCLLLNSRATAEKLQVLQGMTQSIDEARCYECEEASFTIIVRALTGFFQLRQTNELLVLLGDPATPAMFEIQVADLSRLLGQVVMDEATVALVSRAGDGMIVIDLPSSMIEPGKMLISGSGTFEASIDAFKEMIPGGTEFLAS